MTKRDLRTLDLTDYDDSWIKTNSPWILPQLVSIFQDLALVKTGDLISPTQTIQVWKETFRTRPQYWKGLWDVIHKPRSQVLLGSQNSHTRWSVGVPIILSAFLEHRGVKYSNWDWTDPVMETLVGHDIWMSSTNTTKTWSLEEVLYFREEGLRVRSGSKAGQNRSLTSYLPWGGVTDQDFKALPVLSKYMVTQTWIYHPSVRHKFMICDWNNMDVLPPPLVNQDVLDSKQLQTKVRVSTDFDEIFNL